MKHLLVLFLLASGLETSLLAQAPAPAAGDIRITFADGHVQSASAVRRSNNSLLATVEVARGVRGETGYAIASIKKIEFPEPTQLRAARKALDAGKPAEALRLTDALVAQQGELRTIPGNFWARAALLKVDALLALGKEREADPLIKELSADAKNPDQVQGVRIAQAFALLRGGRRSEAVALFNQAIAEGKRPANLARAWLGRGETLLADRDYDGALLAYLRVPIFYSSEASLQPAALLGCAQAYEGLRDFDRARDTLAELTKTYPNSPEATAAKAVSERIQKKIQVSGASSTS